jgi:molecular chaperone GrpE
VTEDTKTPNPENEPEAPEASEPEKDGQGEAQSEVEALQQKLDTTHERLLRTAADLDNLRKRSKRDIDDALVRGHADVLSELLPVMDSMELALASADPDSKAESIIEGVKMIQKQFLTAAERFKLKPIESEGQAFDPNFHEAVAQVASPDHPAGQIVNEMRRGYLLGDRLLRPAMVIVSKGSTVKEAPEAESTEVDGGAEEGPREADDNNEDPATPSEAPASDDASADNAPEDNAPE